MSVTWVPGFFLHVGLDASTLRRLVHVGVKLFARTDGIDVV